MIFHKYTTRFVNKPTVVIWTDNFMLFSVTKHKHGLTANAVFPPSAPAIARLS